VEVIDFQRLIRRHFNIFSERVPAAPKYLRCLGPPYDPSDPDCKSVDLPTHGHGFAQIKGIIIETRFLRKFDISEEAFKDAYNAPPQLSLLNNEG